MSRPATSAGELATRGFCAFGALSNIHTKHEELVEAQAPFYVYVHAKPDGTPFYVGKGRLARARYLGRRNPWHTKIVAKYGAPNIKITLVQCASEAEAFRVERETIARLRAEGVRLCNFTAGGEGGADPIPETRARLSAAAKRRGISEATRLAVSLAKKGVPLSSAHRAKVSDALRASWRNRTLSDEQRENLSTAAKRRGIARAILEAAWDANRSSRRPHTEATKEKMRRAARPISAVTREAARKANLGRRRGPMSEATKAKLRAAALARLDVEGHRGQLWNV